MLEKILIQVKWSVERPLNTFELFVVDFEYYMYANLNVSLRFATFRTFDVRTAIKKIRQIFPCTIILACTFIYFSSDFSPVRLFWPVRLLIPVLFSLLYVYFGLYVYSIPESKFSFRGHSQIDFKFK